MRQDAIDWMRKSGRRSVSLIGTAELPDGSSTRVLLSDLSYEGCQLVAEQDLEVGEVIHLNIPDMGAMQGRVRWVTDGKAGLRFALGTPDADEPRLGVGA